MTRFLDHADHFRTGWVEVQDFAALVKLLASTLARYDREVTAEMVDLIPYRDGRWMVSVEKYGFIGFLDGPLEGAP